MLTHNTHSDGVFSFSVVSTKTHWTTMFCYSVYCCCCCCGKECRKHNVYIYGQMGEEMWRSGENGGERKGNDELKKTIQYIVCFAMRLVRNSSITQCVRMSFVWHVNFVRRYKKSNNKHRFIDVARTSFHFNFTSFSFFSNWVILMSVNWAC